MTKHLEKKLLVSGALALALYYAATCPCDTYLKCHFKEYYGALAVAAVIPYVVK